MFYFVVKTSIILLYTCTIYSHFSINIYIDIAESLQSLLAAGLQTLFDSLNMESGQLHSTMFIIK